MEQVPLKIAASLLISWTTVRLEKCRHTFGTAIWKVISLICIGSLFVNRAVSVTVPNACDRVGSRIILRLVELHSTTALGCGSGTAEANVPKSSSTDIIGVSLWIGGVKVGDLYAWDDCGVASWGKDCCNVEKAEYSGVEGLFVWDCRNGGDAARLGVVDGLWDNIPRIRQEARSSTCIVS